MATKNAAAAAASQNDRFLQQLEDMKRQQKHVERLRTMKSAVDNHSTWDYGTKIDAKKLIRKREKAEQIHKENMKILNKIASIVKRKNETFYASQGFRTHATVNRNKANETIEKENNILSERLKTISSKSVYSRERFEKERQETEKHLKRISHSHQRELREHYIHKFLKSPGGLSAPPTRAGREEEVEEVVVEKVVKSGTVKSEDVVQNGKSGVKSPTAAPAVSEQQKSPKDNKVSSAGNAKKAVTKKSTEKLASSVSSGKSSSAKRDQRPKSKEAQPIKNFKRGPTTGTPPAAPAESAPKPKADDYEDDFN